MLKVESFVNIKDTSGLKVGKLIHVYRGGYGPDARCGDLVMVSAHEKDPHKKLTKTKYLAILVSTKRALRRPSGNYVRFSDNGAVVMQDKDTFKAKKIRGPVSADLKYKKGTKSIILVSQKWI